MRLGIDGRLANDIHRVGVGQYCYEILRAMVPLLQDDELIIYLDAEPKPFFPVQETKNVKIKVLKKSKFWTQTTLCKEINKNPVDLLFSTSLQIPILTTVETACTVLDLAFYDFPQDFTWKFRTKARIQFKTAIKKSHLIFTISESTKNSILKHCPNIKKKIHLIYLGVNDKIKPANEDEKILLREKYKITEPFFLYLGRIQPRKNIIRMLEAYEELLDRYPSLPHHFVLIGSLGWLYEPILAKIKESKYSNRIHYLGYIENEQEKFIFLSMAEALVLVSLWEGFGLPLIEAMKCGTPVITSNCSSLPEVVGDAGLLVDPYNVEEITHALYKICVDPSLKQVLTSKGFERVKLFRWDKTANDILTICRNHVEKQNIPSR